MRTRDPAVHGAFGHVEEARDLRIAELGHDLEQEARAGDVVGLIVSQGVRLVLIGIAVALVIFSFWRPGRAVFGAYLFGGIMALQLRLQASGTQIPSSLLLMLPYGLTVAVLVFSSWRRGKTDEPAALGTNILPAD